MDSIEQRIAKLAPLNGAEHAYHYLHQNNIPLSEAVLTVSEIKACFPLDTENSIEEYRSFTAVAEKMHEGEALPEHYFFQPGQNIAVNKHPRYMPAILHNHDFFEVQYLLKGKLVQTIDDLTVTLAAGDVCFIAPFAKHKPHIVNDDTILINMMVRAGTLKSAFADCLTEQDSISEFFLRVLSGQTFQPILLCHTGLDKKVAHLVLDMLDEANDNNSYTYKLMRAKMEELFLFLLRDHKDHFDLAKSLRKQDDTVLTILRYIQNNYAHVTLSKLAEHFNYSETYLSYLVRTYTGHTFTDILTELRMQYVGRRLLTCADSVVDIMREAGYSDKPHFYRTFRRYYSMTPAQYRTQTRNGKKTKF